MTGFVMVVIRVVGLYQWINAHTPKSSIYNALIFNHNWAFRESFEVGID